MKGTVHQAVVTAALLLFQCVFGSLQAADRWQDDRHEQDQFQPRIVGGSNVDISVFPSTVALIVNSRLDLVNPIYEAQGCGGTLISSTWVLTAAHCLVNRNGIYDPSEISILAGTTDLKAPVTSRTSVSRIFVHPDYRQVVFGDDIALLQLSEPAPAPAISMNDKQLPADELTYIVGWGSLISIREDGTGSFPSVLQSAIVPTLQTSDCAALPGNYQFVDSNTQICAGFPQGGIDSCSGDSGGPLYSVTKEGNLRLAGITSWGDGCAFANQPGVYTDVAAFKNWIEETMGSSSPIRSQDANTPQSDLGTRSSNGGVGSELFLIPVLLLFIKRKMVIRLRNRVYC